MARTIDPPAKREALLEAATELFAERTYAGTAVPLVAERAGVALGTLYRFFPGKRALANAVFQRAKGAMAAAATPSGDVPGHAADEFRVWWSGLIAFSRAHPTGLRFLETQDHDQYLDDDSRAVGVALDAAAAAFVARAQGTGAMRPGPPELLVAMVCGAFVGLHKLEAGRGKPLTGHEQRAAAAAAWCLVAAPDARVTPPAPAPSTHRNERTHS